MSAGPPAKPASGSLGRIAGRVTCKTTGTMTGKVTGSAVGKAASALRLSRLRQPRPLRLRLVDAVTLAAGGLLVLKLLSLSQAEPPPGGELPAFARGLAQARTGYEPKDPATTGSVGQKDQDRTADKSLDRSAEKPAGLVPADPGSPTERALLEKLGARREALRQKTEELELRERMIGEAERKLEAGVGELRQAEDKAEGTVRERAEAERAGMKNIVTMYETMKPKDAARVFDRLGHEVLVPLVLAMNPRKMAEVLAVMQPEAAERLTVALANRARGVAPAQQAAAGLPPNELPAIDPGAPR
jgi:flagellar motility protein MotE (MotC chaperone)